MCCLPDLRPSRTTVGPVLLCEHIGSSYMGSNGVSSTTSDGTQTCTHIKSVIQPEGELLGCAELFNIETNTCITYR